jgi:predicted secreted protein
MRRTTALLATSLLLLAACGDDYGGEGDRDVDGDPVETTEATGTPGDAAVLTLEQTDVQVAVGDTVVIELDENPSVGDQWEVREDPDEAVLEFVEEAFAASDPEADGSGGVLQFVYEAVGDGGTQLTLFNCYRCSDGEPSEEPPEPAEVTFSIEVTA